MSILVRIFPIILILELFFSFSSFAEQGQRTGYTKNLKNTFGVEQLFSSDDHNSNIIFQLFENEEYIENTEDSNLSHHYSPAHIRLNELSFYHLSSSLKYSFAKDCGEILNEVPLFVLFHSWKHHLA